METLVKVLPLESWMREATSEHAELREDFERCVEGRYPKIEPRMKRDGYYYDRKTKVAWFEVGGQAFQCPRPDDFLYALDLANSRRLTTREVEAIQTLIAMRNCPKSLREQLGWHRTHRQLREIELNGLRGIRRFEAFKRERGLD